MVAIFNCTTAPPQRCPQAGFVQNSMRAKFLPLIAGMSPFSPSLILCCPADSYKVPESVRALFAFQGQMHWPLHPPPDLQYMPRSVTAVSDVPPRFALSFARGISVPDFVFAPCALGELPAPEALMKSALVQTTLVSIRPLYRTRSRGIDVCGRADVIFKLPSAQAPHVCPRDSDARQKLSPLGLIFPTLVRYLLLD